MCAVAKYGSIITELKGKVGGQTFQAGKYGPIVKNTNRWIKIRGTYIWMDDARKKGNMIVCSQAWQGLTEDQRSNWITAAASFPAKNKFGDTYTPSGYQIFMKFNLQRLQMSLSVVATPPTPPVFPSMVPIILVSTDEPSISLKLIPHPIADFKIAVMLGAQQSPGRKLPPGGTKFLGYYSPDGAGLVDVTTPYITRFKPPIAEKKLWGYIRMIHIASGVPTPWLAIFSIVEAS